MVARGDGSKGRTSVRWAGRCLAFIVFYMRVYNAIIACAVGKWQANVTR